MALSREELLKQFGALAKKQAQTKVTPQVAKPVVKPVFSETKVRLTPEEQARIDARNNALVGTTLGSALYRAGEAVAAPVKAVGQLMGYQDTPEESALRAIAQSKVLTSQMDISKGIGKPQIIQGRSIKPGDIGYVAGSILPFSAAEQVAGKALGAIAPKLTGTALNVARGAVSGSAIQGLTEAGEGKRGLELAKSVGTGALLGAGADIGLSYLGKVIRNIRAGQKTADAVAEIAQKAPETKVTIEKELGLPEGSTWADIQRKLDEEDAVEALYQKYEAAEPSVVRQPTPTKPMPEPAIITAQKRAQEAVRPVVPELPKSALKPEYTPSVAQRIDQTAPDLAIAPKVAPKVEPMVGTQQPRTVKQQIEIEAITEPGTRERGLSKNVATDINRPQQTIDSFNDDPIFYAKLSNKTTLEKAQSILDKGYVEALSQYEKMGRTFEAHKVPLGIKLSDEAVARGDFDTSRRILADLAEELTSAGQFSQAANILRRSNDPEAATLFIQRQITKLNKDGSEQYGKKWTPVDLTDDELQAIKASAGDQAKYDATIEGIYNRIAKQIPSSKREKFDAWRRMAMLMNPKTHVRNIVGNTLMKGLEKTSDTIANALESIVRPAERTKSIGWSSDKGLVKTVQDSWETVKDDLTNASKYEISGLKAFNREKPIFKTKAIEFMNQLSKSTLEAEDVFFMKGAYQDALGQYMKANKLDTPNANAIEYAKNKAMEATFRSANALSNFIEGIKRKKGVAGVVAEAAIPFSKTPANILMRGIDYSPFGLIKLLASKDKTPAEIIDVIAKGATGSSLVGLGMLLADNGWARGDYTTAKKEGLAELTGEQPMSIITPQGSYTFDWAQPAAVPLAMGIAIQENLKRKNPDAAKIAIEAAAAGGDAIINMSMLQNLKDLMGGGFESPTENILSLPKQYIEQAFPSVVGQFARISDPKQRSSYADTEIQKALNQIKAKTPGQRQTLEPKVDILGREVSVGALPTRIVQNLLSPGSIKKKDTEPVVVELSRLYESGRDTRIIPRVAPKTLERTVKGEKEEMKLTSEQLTKFQKSMGNANADDLRRLFGSIAYQNADDAKKSKLVKSIVEDNYEEEKEKAFKSGSFY